MADRDFNRARAIFGDRHGAATPRDFARLSDVEFIRTQYHIAIATPEATGFRLSAVDAYDQYGWEIISRLADYPAASLIYFPGEPFAAIKTRAEGLQINLEAAQRACGWSSDEIANFRGERPVGFRKIDLLASRLGLAANKLGRSSEENENALSARLRTLLKDKDLKLTDKIVLSIVEASSLVSRFDELRLSFDIQLSDNAMMVRDRRFIEEKKSALGLSLAAGLREHLGLAQRQAVKNVSSLIEQEFDILLMHERLDQNFTGCAVQADDSRGIVLNLDRTDDIFIRRTALAHELGHVLFDSDADLAAVRVDQARIFDDNIQENDRIEQRASLFAVEFLAPAAAIVDMYYELGEGRDALVKIVAHFGVGLAVIKWQLFHSGIQILDEDIAAASSRIGPGVYQRWASSERSAFSYIWNAMPHVQTNRISKLAILAIHLFNKRLISKDSLISILGYPEGDIESLATRMLKIRFVDRLYKTENPRHV